MIRVDRNPQENLSSILPDSLLSQFLRPTSTDRSSSLSPLPDSNSPQTHPEAPPSPLPPAAEEREEPVKLPQREEEEEEETRVEKSSRLSTPFSELSPVPDDLDLITEPDPTTTTEEQKKGPTLERSGSQASATSEPVPQGLRTSPSADKKPPDALINGVAVPTADGSATKAGEYKVAAILELNSELFRLCMEFQKKGIPPTDALYHQFSQRLQSNIGWLAGIADPNRPPTNILSLPIMDPPPTVEFFSCERIQQIYAEFHSFFGKEIDRRKQLGIPLIMPGVGIAHGLNPSQKRERTDEILPDHANKRQNVGESKLSPSQMMPPPSSIPSTATSTPASNTSLLPGTVTQPTVNSFSLSLSNGPSPPSTSPQHFVRLSPDGNAQAGVTQQPMINSQETQLTGATRARQAQIRAPQQQQAANPKSMPANMPGAQNMNPHGPPMGMNPGGGAGAGQGMGNATASHPRFTPQQIFQIMQNPNHPIMQHLFQTIPGFQGLPQQVQMQRVVMTAGAAMQNRNQPSEQQRAAAASMQNVQQGISIQNSAGGMSFPMVNANSAQAAGMGQQNNIFSAGTQNSNPGGVGGPGGMSGVNVNNLNPQQRQQLLAIQQQHQRLGNPGVNAGAGGGANGTTGMMMNAQQQMALTQQQQRMAGAMGTGMGSSMLGGSNDFPASIRGSNSMPGIARSARSPTDATSNPMAQRVGRGASMGPEDYQRMVIKQQQQQQQQGQNPQAAAMFGSSSGGGGAQGMIAGNWGGAGQQGGMGMGGQGQIQNPQLHGMHNMQSMQSMQGVQGMHNMQGMQMQGGYAMSSPTQLQQQPQQHQQAQSVTGSVGLGGGVGSPFLGSNLSSSPPPMGVSSPTWAGSPTQHQQHQAHQVQTQHGAAMAAGMSAGMQGGSGGMNNMFSPFSPEAAGGGGLGDLSGHMAQSQTSPDDFGGLFDWMPS